jgi:hypothetical protein
MRSQEVCRHGLLTLERNGVRIHAHDGSLCAAAKPVETLPSVPPAATEPAPAEPAPAASGPPVAPPAEPAAHPEPLAYETVRAETPPPVAPRPAAAPPDSTARRSRPWLLVAAICAGILLIGAGVAGGLIARDAVDQEKDRTAGAQRRAASLQDRLAAKDATIAGQQGRITEFEQQQRSLEQREAELDQREAELDQREQALATPPGPNATTFGDGIFQTRVAIQPGEYRTEGTDACYWAKLSTGDTNAIIENNLVSGPQTVMVDSPYFESENCGTWTKVTSQ